MTFIQTSASVWLNPFYINDGLYGYFEDGRYGYFEDGLYGYVEDGLYGYFEVCLL